MEHLQAMARLLSDAEMQQLIHDSWNVMEDQVIRLSHIQRFTEIQIFYA